MSFLFCRLSAKSPHSATIISYSIVNVHPVSLTFLLISVTITRGVSAGKLTSDTGKSMSVLIGIHTQKGPTMKETENLRTLTSRLLLRPACLNLKVLLKWIGFSVLAGLVVGSFSTLFAKSLQFVTKLRGSEPWLLFLLPVAGIAITFLYHILNQGKDRGTNLIISSIHANEETPIRVAPMIFTATILTHLCGGSAGREGAALQIGGSIGNFLGKFMPISNEDRHILIMCGMTAAFAAVFGTPMAAAIFSLEIVSVGVMHYAALVPCVLAGLIASRFASGMGIHPEQFSILSIPELTISGGVKTILIGIVCAGVSVIFCIVLHQAGSLWKKYVKNQYLRVVIAGFVIIGLTLVLGTRDYLGAGNELIERAIQEEMAHPAAFLLKIIFTSITISAGYKGGEIVPSFCIGATLGCILGQLLGLSPSLCAAMGMVALFCGVTNCPIASVMISFELFGFEAAPYMLLVIAISYAMSGYYGLYSDQTIVYSKHEARYVNQSVHH